ncbi:hypothetical protein Dimus_005928 [Dionaea muscipula]
MLSKKIARIDLEEMRSRAKARIARKGQEKSAPLSSEPVASAPKTKAKGKRKMVEVVLDEGIISLKFSEESSVYADPRSLMESFDNLLFPRDLQHFWELGTAEVVDLSIQEMMKAWFYDLPGFADDIVFLSTIFQECFKVANLRMKLQNSRLSETTLKEKLDRTEKEVDRLKHELIEKESKTNELTKEMKDVAMNALIEVRGTLMKEFRDGRDFRIHGMLKVI